MRTDNQGWPYERHQGLVDDIFYCARICPTCGEEVDDDDEGCPDAGDTA